MDVKEIDFDNVLNEMEGINIIYGSGYNGRLLYKLLENKGVSIAYFYDDDKSRWGEVYCGQKILSYSELGELDKLSTNVLISSMYIGQILKKIENLGFKNVFVAFDMLMQKDTDYFKFYQYTDNMHYIAALNKLIKCSNDDLTRHYFEVIKETVLAGKALRKICELYRGGRKTVFY